jgi:hypothetical protein
MCVWAKKYEVFGLFRTEAISINGVIPYVHLFITPKVSQRGEKLLHFIRILIFHPIREQMARLAHVLAAFCGNAGFIAELTLGYHVVSAKAAAIHSGGMA